MQLRLGVALRMWNSFYPVLFLSFSPTRSGHEGGETKHGATARDVRVPEAMLSILALVMLKRPRIPLGVVPYTYTRIVRA